MRSDEQALRHVSYLNLSSRQWIDCQPMAVARYDHAVVAHGGRIYAIGGVTHGDIALSTIEVPGIDAKMLHAIQDLIAQRTCQTIVYHLRR